MNSINSQKTSFSFKKKNPKNNYQLQYNLNGSNTDGSFTMDDLNSFFSPYSSRKQIFRDFFLILSWNDMLCVLIRIASSIVV